MVIAVMAGGPLHGQTRTFPEDQLPRQICTYRPTSMPFIEAEPTIPARPSDEVCRYELRWYKGYGCWPPRGPMSRQPAYLCREEPGRHSKNPPANEEQGYFWAVADHLWDTEAEKALPMCVVPDCQEKRRMTFMAAERGRLAGREWQRGDEIRVCPRHGSDIYRAQGARGMDQLAEWLRPDATWDWIDAYDGGTDLLYGAEILERTARMLRLAVQGRAR